jgi:quinol monooxygenase YgiN
MIILKAQLTIDASTRPEFLRRLQELIQASLAEEGCISFGCYEDVAAPNSFLVLAEWSSQAALEQHEQSAHVAAFKTQAGSMIIARTLTVVYSVSHTGGLHG